MKLLLLTLCLPLLTIGCANTQGTTLYNPKTGAKLAEFRPDMDESEYRGGGVYWKVRGHHPSRTITARGAAFTKVIRGTGSAVGEGAQTFVKGGL